MQGARQREAGGLRLGAEQVGLGLQQLERPGRRVGKVMRGQAGRLRLGAEQVGRGRQQAVKGGKAPPTTRLTLPPSLPQLHGSG